jgi:hypothetical protein
MNKFLSEMLARSCVWAPRVMRFARVASALSMVATAAANAAASQFETPDPPNGGRSERVYQYDLSGPRLGATFAPDGSVMTQFGWHFENEASGSPGGPSFIIEKVFLVGGLDQNVFVPNGTLVFGMRLPSSFEFGTGPSVTIDGRGLHSGIVVAAGQSFRAGGIRVPVNVACAWQRGGEARWTILTGWAIRDLVGKTEATYRERTRSRE